MVKASVLRSGKLQLLTHRVWLMTQKGDIFMQSVLLAIPMPSVCQPLQSVASVGNGGDLTGWDRNHEVCTVPVLQYRRDVISSSIIMVRRRQCVAKWSNAFWYISPLQMLQNWNHRNVQRHQLPAQRRANRPPAECHQQFGSTIHAGASTWATKRVASEQIVANLTNTRSSSDCCKETSLQRLCEDEIYLVSMACTLSNARCLRHG